MDQIICPIIIGQIAFLTLGNQSRRKKTFYSICHDDDHYPILLLGCNIRSKSGTPGFEFRVFLLDWLKSPFCPAIYFPEGTSRKGNENRI